MGDDARGGGHRRESRDGEHPEHEAEPQAGGYPKQGDDTRGEEHGPESRDGGHPDQGAEPLAGGHHEHGNEPPADRDSWDARYRSRAGVWSGRPNAQLVTEASGLEPGHALDAGCGEGGDAVWLAQQGWHVTAVDFSVTAVERGRALAAEAGVAERIEWVVADLGEWVPESKFELVTSHFLHVPSAGRARAFARLADAVAPGGTLLVVGHHPADVHAGRPDFADMMFTAEDVAATLDQSWASVSTDDRGRTMTGPDGTEVSIQDTVLVARKD
nr:class I SAM-dependent methyltransferase [Amycolatopsis jejuensis]